MSMKTIIIGLGNPILGDDGIGWRVAKQVREQLSPGFPHPIEFLSLGGISLMEYLVGYERAILIDAIASDRESGSIILSDLSEMPDYSAFHTTSTHDTSLQKAINLGKAMGTVLPEQVIVVGITANHVYEFSEDLSLPVAGAVSRAAQIVIDLL